MCWAGQDPEEEGTNLEGVCWQETPLFPWEPAQNGLA